MRRRPAGDDGTVLLLVIGFAAVLLLMVAVVVNVSAVVLAKRAAASAADGAAVAAAQGLDLGVLYSGGLGDAVPLSAEEAGSRVARYEADVRPEQPGLELVPRLEGRTVVVTARRTVRLPLRMGGLVRDVQVTAVARARAPVLG